MHIVYISREYGESKRGGGIATYIQHIADGLIAKGHRVTVITASDNTKEENIELRDNLTLIKLSAGDFHVQDAEKADFSFLKKFRLFYRFYSFRKKIKDCIKGLKDVDIIEVQDYGAEALYLQDLKIPLVIRLQTPSLLDRKTQKVKKFTFKTIPDWFVGTYENRLIRKAKYITSCSLALKDWTVEHLGLNASMVEVIYNPVNLATINNADYFPKKDLFSVVYAGTVSQEKGVGDLVKAIQILRDQGMDVTLEIAGKLGSYGKKLKETIEVNGASWFTFHGHLQKKNLIKLYQSANVACFPSWWEAMGIVCVEAMYAGPVVLGSNSGGMAEIIDEGKDGFLVSPKSAEHLAERIKFIHDLSDEEKVKISHAAKEKVINLFSLQYLSDQTINFYEKVLKDYRKHEDPLG